ncbi:MAG TPA: DUF1707 domain-containing protein [Solirubrobacteraceae bacterium]|jgi:hypothetical protein|nr:DUF1707 domain-containing protein [Solirubrobacteraceae bacterium]
MLRASDADREQTASRLRHAASEGRLSPEELEQRLQAAFSAKTYDELDWLVCDVPSDGEPTRPKRQQELLPLQPKIAVALAVALLVALMLIAGAAGVGFGRSSGAAGHQLGPPGNAQVQPP